jgi:hypothetical protein
LLLLPHAHISRTHPHISHALHYHVLVADIKQVPQDRTPRWSATRPARRRAWHSPGKHENKTGGGALRERCDACSETAARPLRARAELALTSGRQRWREGKRVRDREDQSKPKAACKETGGCTERLSARTAMPVQLRGSYQKRGGSGQHQRGTFKPERTSPADPRRRAGTQRPRGCRLHTEGKMSVGSH